MKKCTRCGEEKPLEQFHRKTERKDGRKSRCKTCVNSIAREKYSSTIEESRAYHRAMRAKHIVARRVRGKQYYLKNKEAINTKTAANRFRRIKTDPVFKLACTLRDRLRHALKGRSKPKTTQALLGCTFEEAKQYIENQFREGMSWDNHGEWHIDHIKPLASFDLSDEEQLRKACHFSNLQPLWAHENLEKSDKLDYILTPTGE